MSDNFHTTIGYSVHDLKLVKSLSEEQRKAMDIDLNALEKGLREQGTLQDEKPAEQE